MKNLLSYCGLVDAKTRASDKDLPVSLALREDQNREKIKKEDSSHSRLKIEILNLEFSSII